MTKNSNVQLTSNIYPVKVDRERIDFGRNEQFIRRVWDRDALIRLFKYVHYVNIVDQRNLRQLDRYSIPGLSKWQIRRIETPDKCALCPPGDKPWGIVIRGESFEEVCKCNRRDCREFSKCRPEMEIKDGIKK